MLRPPVNPFSRKTAFRGVFLACLPCDFRVKNEVSPLDKVRVNLYSPRQQHRRLLVKGRVCRVVGPALPPGYWNAKLWAAKPLLGVFSIPKFYTR